MEKIEEIRGDLFELEPDEFSDFVADLWEYKGYDVEKEDGRRNTFKAKTGGGLLRSSTIEVVQPFYRRGNKVNKSDVNGVLDYRFDDNVDKIVAVTTTEFTEGARKQEKREEVDVYNGQELANLIIDEGAESVLSKYTPNGSILMGMINLFVIIPLKITWFFVTLPFKILFALMDGGNSESSESEH